MFEVNDRVRLVNLNDPNGGTYAPASSNTIGNVGTIQEKEGEGWFWVTWDNGTSDSYKADNLESTAAPVPPTTTEDVTEAVHVVSGNNYCIPPGKYLVVRNSGGMLTIKDIDGVHPELEMPESCLGVSIVPDVTPDDVINKHLDTVTAERPERSMVEYSLSVNRDKLEKVNNPQEFPDRNWSLSSNKDETLISRLRVKGFSVHSISEASGLPYDTVLVVTNKILKPQ